MRCVLLVVAVVLGGCAFEPAGGAAPGDDDVPQDVDASQVANDDASAADFDAEASTTPDALLELDASLPLPDAGMPIDAPGGPTSENACTNGNDDDHDGDTDCRDSDCPSCSGLSSCCASGACALICL